MINLLRALVPIRVSSGRYFRQQLVRFGVDVSILPPACIQELADRAVRLSRESASAKGGNWRVGVADALEIEAVKISYLLDDADAAGRQMVEKDYLEKTVPILSKYGVRIPSTGL